ncbi:MAG TPA: hypothetical protein VFN75_11385 [Pseudonocardiaceae bacterium]|nr:hypothetical protein [Pseudonocardiaceae bacterium]
MESATLGWNVIGVVVLAAAALSARSVALAGFGLDSLIEIGASTVVIWELSGTGLDRQRRALRLIGSAFLLLATYLAAQSTFVLLAQARPHPSPVGIAWTGVTALVMFGLAAGKARVGTALANPVLRTEGRVTLVDGLPQPRCWSAWWSTPGGAGGGQIHSRPTCWSSTPSARAEPLSDTEPRGSRPWRSPSLAGS